MKSFATLLLLATSTGLGQTPAPPAPEILYVHGIVITGAHLRDANRLSDSDHTPARVTAIAVSHGVITAVGSDADILKVKSQQTKVIDLQGAFAMPGFNDAHTHIAAAGHQKISIDLDGATSLTDMLARIRTFAATAPAGSWLEGGGWDHTKWPSQALPTRVDLDSVTGNHPAMFYRTDGHIVVANSAALAAAGVVSGIPDPSGGKIDRDATGSPTGIVRESPAIALLTSKIPRPTSEARRKALSLAIADALAHGVTSVQDFSDWGDFLILEQMERDNALHVRVSEWLNFNDPVDLLKQHRASHPQDDPLLHTGMLKGFVDGSLGSRTAALAKPYADDPTNSGIPRYDQKTLDSMTIERAAAGFQIGFHAIGDHANATALDAFTVWINKIQARCSPQFDRNVPASAHPTGPCGLPFPAQRFRIEHAQVVSAGDFDRFAKLHVIASMQPSHLITDMNWAAARLGPVRALYSYAWRSMLDHGVTLAFGTDYPVESINPFRGLYAAITRQNESGTATYQPQEKLTLDEAIYAYTQGSAYAEKSEQVKGRLEPGFLADFIVLDHDIFAPAATAQQLLQTRILRTIVNGETVYQAPQPTAP